MELSSSNSLAPAVDVKTSKRNKAAEPNVPKSLHPEFSTFTDVAVDLQVSLILATDMATHFEFLGKFRAALSVVQESRPPLEALRGVKLQVLRG